MTAGKKVVRIVLLSLVCLLVASVIFGQDFWTQKPFNQWTNEELKKFTTDSPWAKEITMATAPPRDSGGGGGGGGGRGGGGGGGDDGGGGGGGGDAGGGGGGGGGGRGGGGNVMKLVVTWQSAMPIKQANVRGKMPGPGEVPADAKQYLENTDEFYVVMVEGMPQNFARQALADAPKIKKSVLKVGKREIALNKFGTNARGRNIDFVLLFEKKEAIKVEENEVEVVVKLGIFEVKKKFKLKDMIVAGKLEL